MRLHASLMHAHIQDTPHEACLAALTLLKTLSLVRPPNEHTQASSPILGFGDRPSTLSSLCSLQVWSAAALLTTADVTVATMCLVLSVISGRHGVTRVTAVLVCICSAN
jgi:hypothetical protein